MKIRHLLWLWVLGACRDPSTATPLDTFPEPSSAPALRGPGGPQTVFDQSELFLPCGNLEGGSTDVGVHGVLAPYRGHVLLPWAPGEAKTGGLSLYDVSDPCDASLVGETTSTTLRSTDALGLMHLRDGEEQAGDWAVTNYLADSGESGVMIWDLSDPTAPLPASQVTLPGTAFSDDGAASSQGLAWQFPWLYVAAGHLGVFVVDTSDLLAPVVVAQYSFDDGLRASDVHALGGRLLVGARGSSQAALLDISIPEAPTALGIARIELVGTDGEPAFYEHLSLVGSWAVFGRTDGGGGPLVYDVSHPYDPTWLGETVLPDLNGGYIAYDEGFLFQAGGEAAAVFEARDIADPNLTGTGLLDGQVRHATPLGNVVFVALTHPEEPTEGTVVMPWFQQPDRADPEVLHIDPVDGALGVSPYTSLGVAFNELIEPSTVFPGSIRLYDATGAPVNGWTSVQGRNASYTPRRALTPGMSYRIEVLAEGVSDVDAHALSTTLTSTFTVAN